MIKGGYKSGQNVSFAGQIYLFLGYKNEKLGIIADSYGNKVEVWVRDLSFV